MVGKQERRSAKGSRFAFIELSDPTGTIEVALFSEVLSASRELLESSVPLLISVNAQLENGAPRVTARDVQALDAAIGNGATNLEVHLVEPGSLERLRATLEEAGAGRGRVRLVLEIEGREVEVALPGGYAVSPAVRMAIEAFPGVSAVEQI